MDAVKRIVLVVPSLKCGGAERVISELANVFSDSNEVTILLLHKQDRFYEVNEKVHVVEPSFSIKGFSRILYIFRILFYIRNNVKKNNPDAVMSFGRIHSPYIILALLGTAYPVFVSDRGSPFYKGKWTNELVRKIIYKYATGIISQTKFSKEIIQKTIKHKNIAVISNPIREVVQYDHKREKNIIFVGRLIKGKGLNYLLEAFASIKAIDWKLLIIGDGPEKQNLKKLATDLGVHNQVVFQGFVDNVDFYLSKSEIFAFPSLSEGFPNALMEAMANGLACVSFDCVSGPRELINEGENGFLIPLKDVKMLANKINYLIENPEIRFQFQENALKINKEYDLKAISGKYLSFILNQN